jgi:hypothetical protein
LAKSEFAAAALNFFPLFITKWSICKENIGKVTSSLGHNKS